MKVEEFCNRGSWLLMPQGLEEFCRQLAELAVIEDECLEIQEYGAIAALSELLTAAPVALETDPTVGGLEITEFWRRLHLEDGDDEEGGGA